MTVRRLTLNTAIFMPLTLLAGIGGMSEWSRITGPKNWRVSYPAFMLGPERLELFTDASRLMVRNDIQFQKGHCLPLFQRLYDTEDQCEAAMERARWPNGFHSPLCNGHEDGLVDGRRLKRYHCRACSHLATLTGGLPMWSAAACQALRRP